MYICRHLTSSFQNVSGQGQPAGSISIAQAGIDYVLNDVFMPKLDAVLDDLQIPDQKISQGDVLLKSKYAFF